MGLDVNKAIDDKKTKTDVFEDNAPTKRPNSKIGRPKIKKQNRRNVQLTVLLTKEENEILEEKAGLTPKGAFVRACLQELEIF